MKKKYSLKDKNDFNKIIKNGKKIYSKYFVVFFVNSNNFKIGISVPKKNGNAVYRNKNKRRIKNILNNELLYNDLKKNIVIIFKKEANDVSFILLEEEILIILEKIRKNGK